MIQTTLYCRVAKLVHDYMYVKNVGDDSNVRGWKGDPGPQGHFHLMEVLDRGAFYIRPLQWFLWYVYVQAYVWCTQLVWSHPFSM